MDGRTTRWWARAVVLLVAGGATAAAAQRGSGEISDAYYSRELRTVEVPLYKSRVIELPMAPKKVSVGNDAIADILMMRSRQMYVLGKSLGSTNLTLWGNNNELLESINLSVTYDLETLKERLHRLLPDEDVEVHASEGAIVLSGSVSSPSKMEMAVDLARGFVSVGPKEDKKDEFRGRVVNLLQVGGAKQVLLEVKVAEMSRQFIRELGIKFNSISADGNISVGALTGGGQVVTGDPFPNEIWGPVGEGLPIPHGSTQILPDALRVDNYGLFASFLDGDNMVNLAIDAAKEEGMAKVLAEPTLTTLTGEQADFIAGGEFPVPVPDDDGDITIVFKEFGVGLRFVPVVLDAGTINLKVDVEVSELSTDNSVIIPVGASGTFFIPSLRKRAASTTVELGNGQTIGIAGLINESLRERVDKFPGLGDIPILGALFSSKEYVKGQTELVIFVTPRYAYPVVADRLRLPTDKFVDPSDVEFYLLGRLSGTPEEENAGAVAAQPTAAEGIEGRFGHQL